MAAAITRLVIVIPARDEAAFLDRAVRAALDAMNRVQRTNAVRTSLVIVLDSCLDNSRDVVREAAAGDPRVQTLEVLAGSVGRSRALGIDHALRLATEPLNQIWIANSDADSSVPPDWCSTQLAHAQAGADAVLGTVFPSHDRAPESVIARWASEYRTVEGHPHVHGANLGVRADAYFAVGGFAPVSSDEDVRLTTALRRHRYRVVATAEASVATSFRTSGRAPLGFADYLARVQGGAGEPQNVGQNSKSRC